MSKLHRTVQPEKGGTGMDKGFWKKFSLDLLRAVVIRAIAVLVCNWFGF